MKTITLTDEQAKALVEALMPVADRKKRLDEWEAELDHGKRHIEGQRRLIEIWEMLGGTLDAPKERRKRKVTDEEV